MVGVHHEGQIAPARDASDLLGKLGQGQDDEIRRSQNGPRGNRAGEHSHLEPQ